MTISYPPQAPMPHTVPRNPGIVPHLPHVLITGQGLPRTGIDVALFVALGAGLVMFGILLLIAYGSRRAR